MRTTFALALALALALVVVALGAALQAQAATPKTSICGQIKHGPHAAYTSLLTGKKLSGDTWTVFATGVGCPAALKAAPLILKWWAKAKIESHATVAGFTCGKESDGHGSAGSAGCLPVKGKPLTNIELMMTGSMSIAQLKTMFGG